jgi:hypothetical protein
MKLPYLNSKALHDGRKYKMSIFAMFIMLVTFVFTGYNELVKETYTELLMGLSSLYAVYCGSNVGNKWVLGKHGKLVGKEGDLQDPPTE